MTSTYIVDSTYAPPAGRRLSPPPTGRRTRHPPPSCCAPPLPRRFCSAPPRRPSTPTRSRPCEAPHRFCLLRNAAASPAVLAAAAPALALSSWLPARRWQTRVGGRATVASLVRLHRGPRRQGRRRWRGQEVLPLYALTPA